MEEKEKGLFDYVICFVPMIGMVLAQLLASLAVTASYALMVGVQMAKSGVTDVKKMADQVLANTNEVVVITLVAANLITIILFGIWYSREANREESGKALKKLFQGKNILLFLLLGIAIQIATSMVLTMLEGVTPKAMEEYGETLESTGMGTTPLSLLAVVILAPIAEELVFRGMTLKLAGRVLPFLGANCVQAMLFGIVHGNIIQACYAFLFGIILGFLYKTFRTIYAPILLHLIINLAGCIVGALTVGIDIPIGAMAVMFFLSLLLGAFSFLKIQNQECGE